ncbi:Hypothetical predicted protein [Cloeon dipterum]|uniref:Uncharacterized protein n=1 Tax=Cloeon dipterum TaxID=197152 RepID=A0A8S1E166_9INSE|nr:Hypothetical predicted protein [Cloeon dipterum]
MAGPYSAPCKVPASLLQEELMDFENAATHFHSDDSWSLSELDDEALQGIVSGKSTSAATAASTGDSFASDAAALAGCSDLHAVAALTEVFAYSVNDPVV